jgi:nucleoside-diphosphate-sugar epimerase
MRVFVAGGTGAIGKQLTPLLASAGHEVYVLVRQESAPGRVDDLGGHAVIGDLLDAGQVANAVGMVEPEAVVHMATAIPRDLSPRKFAEQFATTNRLRSEGTRNLLSAASKIGASRVISQSIAFAYDPHEGLANEDDPLWSSPPKTFAPALASLQDIERQTILAGGIALRFGHLYGPGTSFAPDGGVISQIRAGKLPRVGGGTSVFSFTHTYDAASAVLAGLDTAFAGPLNIVDDEPAPVREWLPYLAKSLGAPAPKSVPTLLARTAVGAWGTAYMTQLRGADNARAKTMLDWKPRYGSWRSGFAEDFGWQ